MWIAIIIAIVLVAAILAFRRTGQKNRERMKELGATDILIAFHVDGLPLPTGKMSNLYACPNRLVVDSEGKSFEINTITNYAIVTEQEIKNVDKSVIGRAVVGGVLLGGLGAIIGGMSGIGTKTKTGKERRFFVVNYLNDNGEQAAISFENHIMNIDYFVSRFSASLGKPAQYN